MGPGESMSIWHLLFGFDGRINRKTYIIAIIVLMLVMAALMLAGAAVATGDPLSSSLWAFRRENIGIWGPIYAGVILLTLWPALALATKRLHDRNYPTWVCLLLYAGLMISGAALLWFSPLGLDAALQHKSLPIPTLISVLLLGPVGLWFSAQVMFMRGVAGPNEWGPDPLAGFPPPGHEPRTFWNVAFNPDGRMSRKMWWLMFMSLSVLFVVWGAIYGAFLALAMSSLPQGADPGWIASPEGQKAIMNAILPVAIPLSLVLYLLLWPAFAAGTKRLHDRGRSGWVLASYYVPYALFAIAGSMLQSAAHNGAVPEGLARWLMIAAGVILAGLSLWLLVELGFLKGEPRENAYGPDPRTV
jgi:uncharacterized membrane protein YhaH (DUF805 family)